MQSCDATVATVHDSENGRFNDYLAQSYIDWLNHSEDPAAEAEYVKSLESRNEAIESEIKQLEENYRAKQAEAERIEREQPPIPQMEKRLQEQASTVEGLNKLIAALKSKSDKLNDTINAQKEDLQVKGAHF